MTNAHTFIWSGSFILENVFLPSWAGWTFYYSFLLHCTFPVGFHWATLN